MSFPPIALGEGKRARTGADDGVNGGQGSDDDIDDFLSDSEEQDNVRTLDALITAHRFQAIVDSIDTDAAARVLELASRIRKTGAREAFKGKVPIDLVAVSMQPTAAANMLGSDTYEVLDTVPATIDSDSMRLYTNSTPPSFTVLVTVTGNSDAEFTGNGLGSFRVSQQLANGATFLLSTTFSDLPALLQSTAGRACTDSDCEDEGSGDSTEELTPSALEFDKSQRAYIDDRRSRTVALVASSLDSPVLVHVIGL